MFLIYDAKPTALIRWRGKGEYPGPTPVWWRTPQEAPPFDTQDDAENWLTSRGGVRHMLRVVTLEEAYQIESMNKL